MAPPAPDEQDEAAEPDELDTALVDRVEQAVEESRRSGGLATRCAWCGRYRLGVRWVLVEEVRGSLGAAGVSHGICDDCVAALRSAGLSV